MLRCQEQKNLSNGTINWVFFLSAPIIAKKIRLSACSKRVFFILEESTDRAVITHRSLLILPGTKKLIKCSDLSSLIVSLWHFDEKLLATSILMIIVFPNS